MDSDCSIADLPVELVLKIFKFLDNKSRLNASTTCKSWKCLTDVWLKWPLSLHNSFKLEGLQKTKRKFCTIHLKGKIALHLVSELLQPTDLAAITAMTVNRTTFQPSQFTSFLKMFPNLESLELYSVKLQSTVEIGQHVNDSEKPDFEQLTKLNFSLRTDPRLLQYFTKAKLTTLICREQQFTRATVWGFLSTQKDLKKIDFCRIASNAMFQFGIDPSSINFTLTEIALDYESVMDFNGITDLLLHQPNNFERVELGHIPVLPVYAIIFSNLKSLTTLHLMPGSVGRDLSNELQLQPLESVTNLRIYDGVNHGLDLASIEGMTAKVIENLPNLENLELLVPYKQIYYQTIVTNLKKLKSLTIRVTFHTKLDKLKYPSVQSLRINCFTFRECEVRHHPIYLDADAGIQEAVRSLTYEGATNKRFFDFIRRTFPKLELLDVREDLADCEHATVAGIHEVHYRDTDFFVKNFRFKLSSAVFG